MWWKKKSLPKSSLIVDVSSGTVGAAFVVRERGKQSNVNASSRLPIKEAQKGAPYERYYLSMVSALTDALGEVWNAHAGVPEEIEIYLRSPWLASASRTISHEEREPFTVREKDLSQMVAFEEENFLKALDEEAEGAGGHEIIESRLDALKLNGYLSPHPSFPVKTKSVEAKIFFSVSPTAVLKGIGEVVGKFYQKPLSVRSFSKTLCQLTSRYVPDLKDYLVCDIGALSSEISVVRDCIVIETMTFPEGYVLLGTSLGGNSSGTSGILDAHARGDTEAGAGKEIERKMNPALGKWVEGVSKTLDKFSGMLALPSTIFLISDGTTAQFFAEALQNESFAQYLVTEKKFNVIIVADSTFQGLCLTEKCRPDAVILAEATAGGN